MVAFQFLAHPAREFHTASRITGAALRFGITDKNGVGVIEAIAQQRGFRLRGGAADFEKAGLMLLQDYRNGTLGRISLETPASRAAMLAEAADSVTTVVGTTDEGINSL